MDVKKEMNQIIETAYADTPGLEGFQKRKKVLLWALVLLALAQKAVLIFLMGATSWLGILIGLTVGMGVAAIFALAAYRGPWKVGFVFYLLGLIPAVDVAKAAGPLFMMIAENAPLASYGGVLLLFSLETAYAVLALGLALWMTIPPRSRQLGEAAHEMGKACNKLMKEAQPPKTPLTPKQ
ncbi:hypothetical protein [Bacilliculturomica massiliensis]|uniref:hypothetical protein n=1 Tax=Bacilliculturomica massiliensis TaxID=1917867 RepID=UPI0010323E08|nr:hypothetical protein [Bacilliculturomica massiliensis]